MKTISVSEELHKEIVGLKLEEKKRNAEELLEELVLEHKKMKFLEASATFRRGLDAKKLRFPDLLIKSRKLRGEISDEWF